MPAKTESEKKAKVYINRKFFDTDFSGQDLTHADFRGCTLVNCNFDNSNLRYATFEGANCMGSSFRQASLYHTNFKDAILQKAILDPRDAFGMTLSIACDTFDKAELGKIWLAGWLYLPLLAQLPEGTKEKLEAILVDLIGEERLKGLERHFADRTL